MRRRTVVAFACLLEWGGAGLRPAMRASGAEAAQSGAEDVRLTAARSVLYEYPSDVVRISTSNPDIVDAVAVSTREVLLNPKQQGAATVVVWTKQGPRRMYQVSVDPDLDSVRRLLKTTFPAENIQVQGARDSISLTGHVRAPHVAERAAALVAPLAKAVVNNLTAGTVQEKQVLLRVRIAELNRLAAESFGVNLVSTGAANTPGSVGTQQFSASSPAELTGVIGGSIRGTSSKFTITDALNVFAFRPDLNLAAFIKALQSRQLLQILAEPNLVATSGKEASFLVGGEFPVPVIQGGANAGAITIVFREFGIRLTFLPVVTERGTIRMHVKPEVSSIDVANSVTFSGFTIPALSTRRMETDIELGEGQSFVIAGLLDDRVTETLSRVPGLSHIPLLGAIFRSRQQNRTKTELLVMVTPESTRSLGPSDPKPMLEMPKDFLGPLEKKAAPAKNRGARKEDDAAVR